MESNNGRPGGGGDGDGSGPGDRFGSGQGQGRPEPGQDRERAAPEDLRQRDPWSEEPGTGRGGRGEGEGAGARGLRVPVARGARPDRDRDGAAAAEVYLAVQRSAAFQEVRSRYRRFVVPAVVAFLGWYLVYVVTATSAPGFMARPVAGAVNVAMVAGAGQFLSTFLLAWAYARHARLRRDRAALELRWETQELTRSAVQGGGGA
ncbi:DUF485 domain-containing protein [Streptomyces sp. NPDC058319]|uniref:DUF485 domain-containing protein n=1 Tax=unclassified Streptomyces TaxID=2593676 RepID=UPI0036E4EF33